MINIAIVEDEKKEQDFLISSFKKLMLEKDILSTNIYTLGFESDSWGNLDFSKKIVIK